ncbi:MAG: hypothetical protein QM270_04145 [Bacillota bacterium]|nr:hypothetical protein [Bacillota bacterium]
MERQRRQATTSRETNAAGIRRVEAPVSSGRARDEVTPRQRREYLRAARRRGRRARFRRQGDRLRRAVWLRSPLTQLRREAGRHVLTEDWLEARKEDGEDAGSEAIEPRRLPGWLLPAIVLVLLLAGLFVVLPRVLAGVGVTDPSAVEDPGKKMHDLYDDDAYAVVLRPVVNVYARPDIKAERVTQLLYNAPVRLGDPGLAATGFTTVLLEDGTAAFVKTRDLTRDQRSIEPAGYEGRVVVADLAKRVMTHASAGNLIVEVKLGTVLYYVYQSSTVYRVALPDGGEGWMDSSGLIPLAVDQRVEVAEAQRFASTLRAFVNSTLLHNGISNSGASIHGIVQQAAAVNGLSLPHTMVGQMEISPPVQNYLNLNGTVNYSRLEPGDLLFFSSAPPPQATSDGEEGEIVAPDLPTDMGVWLDYGIVLMESERSFVLRELELTQVLEKLRLLDVRRPFVQE